MATVTNSKTILKQGRFKLGFICKDVFFEVWEHKNNFYILKKPNLRISCHYAPANFIFNEISKNSDSIYTQTQFGGDFKWIPKKSSTFTKSKWWLGQQMEEFLFGSLTATKEESFSTFHSIKKNFSLTKQIAPWRLNMSSKLYCGVCGRSWWMTHPKFIHQKQFPIECPHCFQYPLTIYNRKYKHNPEVKQIDFTQPP